MSAHTPGPWVAKFESGSYGRYALIRGPRSGREQAIAEIASSTADEFTKEDRANADLIAAAPDLLAALKRVGCQDAGSCGPDEVDGRCFVCSSIAKAEGER